MKNDKHTTAIPEVTITQVHGQMPPATGPRPLYHRINPARASNPAQNGGGKGLAFVEKAHDYAVDNPTLTPSYLDMAVFDVDFADAHGLWSLLTLIRQLEEAVEDTVMAAGSEAFHAALAFYHNVQIAAKDDIPGAKSICEDLKTRFPGGRRKGGAADGTGDGQVSCYPL